MTTTIIEKLLAGAEVEWKPLGEVCELTRGRVISKQYLIEHRGQYPVYSSQTANGGEIGRLDTSDFDGEFLNWTTDGANAGTIFYRNGKFSLTNVSGLIRIKKIQSLDYKYLFYWLSIEMQKHVYFGMGNPKLMSHQVQKIPIPIPPLSVQKEIVRILDAFTAHTAKLTAELTAELTERQKQYNYYRDKLLTFSETEVEWKTLGDIACYSNSRIRYQALTETNYVGVDNLKQNRGGKNDSKFVPKMGSFQEFLKGDILIGNIRPYLKKIWLSNQVGGASGDILVIRVNDNKIYNKYLYQILSDDKFFNYYIQYSKGAKMPRGDKKSVLDYILPVPSLEKQKKIVSILDKFEALINSITEGLPREIELRNKQYEYYRDQLLNFPKPEDKVEKQNVCELVK